MNRRIRTTRRGFTITELLVAIAIIAVLGGLTVVAIRSMAAEAKVASGINTVTAALNEARAQAMKRNESIMVCFRPRLLSPKKQVVDVVLARWTREMFDNQNQNDRSIIARYVPLDGVRPRSLPEGIKVAAPRYRGIGNITTPILDEMWITQTHLPAINQNSASAPENEWPGAMIGVVYAPDGTVRMRHTDANRMWLDIPKANETLSIRWQGVDYVATDIASTIQTADIFEQWYYDDEPFVQVAPFLAVYNDGEARERRVTEWRNQADYEDGLVGPLGYIEEFSKRIHFSPYTGVVMTEENG